MSPHNTQKNTEKIEEDYDKKNSVSLVLRSGATPQSSILCILWALFFFIFFH